MNKSFISFCLRRTKDKSKLSHNFWSFSGLHTLNKEIISPQSCSCFHTKWNITLYHIIPCNIMQCHTISYNLGQYDNMKGQFIFLLQIQIGISIFSHFHCLSTLFYPILTADRERSWQTYFWREKISIHIYHDDPDKPSSNQTWEEKEEFDIEKVYTRA